MSQRLKFIPPMLPTLAEEPPRGADWLHEIKHDGYRTQLAIENGTARAYTRRGFDWTDKYQPIVQAAAKLPARSAIMGWRGDLSQALWRIGLRGLPQGH
jgi:bifunctional non-homologous end joining protein LigD